ncbi:PIPO, partial [Sunflower chlorotic mottle virus]|uniref:PIPO n=1 Tax=Sunflower chlorotic mottle virus TaxID=129732 RepID=UPI0002654FF2
KLSRSLTRGMVRLNLVGKIICNLAFTKSQATYCSTFATHRKSRFEGLVRHITKCMFGKEFKSFQERKRECQ